MREMRFAGSLLSADKALFEVFGAPFDGNAVKKGAAKAPRAVRRASHTLESFLMHRRLDISDVMFYDAGDISVSFPSRRAHIGKSGATDASAVDCNVCDVRGNDAAVCHATINEKAGEEKESCKNCKNGNNRGDFGRNFGRDNKGNKGNKGNERRKVFIGGDHSVSVALVKELHERYPRMKVFVLDAHADFRDEYKGNRYSNASASRRIAEIVGYNNIILIGVRSASAEEYEFIRDKGVRIYSAEDVCMNFEGVLAGISAMSEESNASNPSERKRLGEATAAYLSIDIDVLDPSIAPGVEYPEPCGLSVQQVVALLSHVIRTNNVVAADVVEVHPRRDVTGTTSICAARIVMEILAEFYEKYAPESV